MLPLRECKKSVSGVSAVSGDCAAPGQTNAMCQFLYDGDGNIVELVYTVTGGSSLTTYTFAGGAYEVQDNGTTQKAIQNYAFAGMTVAMNAGFGLTYFLTDHLGSLVAVSDASGSLLQQQPQASTQDRRCYPFSEVRDLPTDGLAKISATDFGYTGQRADADENGFSLGLTDYRVASVKDQARFYDAALELAKWICAILYFAKIKERLCWILRNGNASFDCT